MFCVFWFLYYSFQSNPHDPINHLCSLTGKYISEKYFTYRSVPTIIYLCILQNLIRRTRSCSTGFITQSSFVFHFHQINMIGWKYFTPQLYQFRRSISEGPALKLFYMIHRGGRVTHLENIQIRCRTYKWVISHVRTRHHLRVHLSLFSVCQIVL